MLPSFRDDGEQRGLDKWRDKLAVPGIRCSYMRVGGEQRAAAVAAEWQQAGWSYSYSLKGTLSDQLRFGSMTVVGAEWS